MHATIASDGLGFALSLSAADGYGPPQKPPYAAAIHRFDLPVLGVFLLMDHEHLNMVAVVDDDDDVGEVLRGLLETMGYQVETYRSGAEFLATARTSHIACLVVDQNMPSMTGLDLISKLMDRGTSIPTLLITGIPDPEIRRRASALGVMKVLEKPMSHHELLRFVEFSIGS